MKKELLCDEANITVSLRFTASNIELVLEKTDFKGWTVELFVEPCAVRMTLYQRARVVSYYLAINEIALFFYKY